MNPVDPAHTIETPAPSPDVQSFHRKLPGYEVTPLVDAPELALSCAVGRVLVKDESQRLGLPAYKVLGASWAVWRLLQDRLGITLDDWGTIDELASVVRERIPALRFVSATDGNHGRGLARVASWLGSPVRIFMPAGTTSARIRAIAGEGAAITIGGEYDEAVENARIEARRSGAWLVQDTSWEGYSEVPGWIVDGYSTLGREIDEQERAVDAAIVPIGVGSLAMAIARHFAGRGVRVIGVEPDSADCALQSVRAGSSVRVPGPHRSIMAGLNCGTVSRDGLDDLRNSVDAFVSIDDDRAREAMRALASAGIESGESGAASTGALLELVSRPDALCEFGLGEGSTVLLLSTEGATDPASWERITGLNLPSFRAGRQR